MHYTILYILIFTYTILYVLELYCIAGGLGGAGGSGGDDDDLQPPDIPSPDDAPDVQTPPIRALDESFDLLHAVRKGTSFTSLDPLHLEKDSAGRPKPFKRYPDSTAHNHPQPVKPTDICTRMELESFSFHSMCNLSAVHGDRLLQMQKSNPDVGHMRIRYKKMNTLEANIIKQFGTKDDILKIDLWQGEFSPLIYV